MHLILPNASIRTAQNVNLYFVHAKTDSLYNLILDNIIDKIVCDTGWNYYAISHYFNIYMDTALLFIQTICNTANPIK